MDILWLTFFSSFMWYFLVFRLRLNNFCPLFWMNPKSCLVLYSGLGKRFTWCTIGSQDQGFSHQPSDFTKKLRCKMPIWNGFTGMTVSMRTVFQIQNMTKTVCLILYHFILHQDIFTVFSHSAVFKFGGFYVYLTQIFQNWVLFHLSSCEDCFPSWNSQFRL